MTEFEQKLPHINDRDGFFQIRDAIFKNATKLHQKDFDAIEAKIQELVEANGLTYERTIRVYNESK